MINRQLYSQAVKKLEPDYGPFILFGLFLREDSPDRWDLLVSSRWLARHKLSGLSEFTQALTRIVGLDEFVRLSRVVTLNRDESGLEAILRAVGVKKGVAELRDVNFSGVQVTHGFVFRANRAELAAESIDATDDGSG